MYAYLMGRQVEPLAARDPTPHQNQNQNQKRRVNWVTYSWVSWV